jgi:hypothetical protein
VAQRQHVLRHPLSLSADAIVSLANTTTVVGDVAGTLSEFATLWVTTPSDYDTIFAATVHWQWARLHRPVLSTGRDDHVMYTGFHTAEPLGQLTRCPRDCGVENRSYHVSGRRVIVTCRGCNAQCSLDKVGIDASKTLGSRSLLKVAYPPALVAAHWVFKEPRPPAPIVVAPVTAASTRDPRTTSMDQSSVSVGSRLNPAVTSQTTLPRAALLAPPRPDLYHARSLPELSPRTDTRPSEPAPSMRHLGTSTDSRPLQAKDLPPTPNITLSNLVIKLPGRPASLPQPPSQIVRSQSTPQLGEQRETSKRGHSTLELSTLTPVAKRQRKVETKAEAEVVEKKRKAKKKKP